jgi:hypothetical protein
MNRDMHIEEMARVIHNTGSYNTLYERDSNWLAQDLYNSGYRKASEVAEDIVRMLRAAGINEWRYPIVAEIKKKYTESEKEK